MRLNKVDTGQLPTLTPIGDVRAAAYNPRETDPARLAFLRTSLTKLGFLLPLYATPEGHLLSGHQRMLVAEELGCTHVPVVRIEVAARRLKNVNLLFNRATNDMRREDTSETLLTALGAVALGKLTNEVADKTPSDPAFFRCMGAEQRPLSELVKLLPKDEWEPAAISQCDKLLRCKVVMPIVLSKSGKIVNGRYRLLSALEGATEGGMTHYPVVEVPDEDAELAIYLMNMVSMSFTVEKQYADNLRYGGFRRADTIVEELVTSFRFFADGNKFKPPKDSFRKPQEFWQRWRKEHGKSVLDLGAGQRRNEIILHQKGVECRSWEPYPCPWAHPTSYGPQDMPGDPKTLQTGFPHPHLARLLSRDLLAEVAAGKKWDSVFANAVVNSIPFHEDRIAFLTLAHALTAFGSTFYGTARNHESLARNAEFKNDYIRARSGTFELPYEKGIIVGNISHMPKVQKFHTEASLRPMLEAFFLKVETWPGNSYIAFRCSAPRRVDPAALKWALTKQFDLPYPDHGTTLGMAQEAIDAFSKRLRVDLNAFEALDPSRKIAG